MKKLTALLLLLAMCFSFAPTLAEEGGGDLPEDVPLSESLSVSDALHLPLGVWTLTSSGVWTYMTQTDATLTPEQSDTAAAEGIMMLDGNVMPSGTLLTVSQMTALYPGAEAFFNVPSITPDLEMFSLTGEWLYNADDELVYRHGEGYVDMTADEVFAALNGKAPAASGSEKIIYLTIDDTPSQYTMELLAVLDRLDVKATFFVVGAYAERRPVFMRAIYEQGHTIANHSYSHDGGNLASSFRNCLRDFERCEEAVEAAIGRDIDMPILRVPYGSTTIPAEYRTQLQERGYMWIDWNALNGDTEPEINSDQDALDRAISTAGRYDGSIVMLVHDGKKRTIRTMEAMVEHFHQQGYVFRVLDTNIEKIPGVRTGYPK